MIELPGPRDADASKNLFNFKVYYSIVRDWQIFGYGSDFPTWSEVGTKSRAKVPNFGGNFESSYLRTGKSF